MEENICEVTKEAHEKVLSIIKDIQDDQKHKDQQISEDSKLSNKPNNNATKGLPKSGRFWKSDRDRFSSINKTRGLKQDFQKKTTLRLELKRTKEISKQLREQMKEKELERKQRRRDNIKKTEENRKNAEVVQVITNTAKLKRMRKKQLRFIEKRDTNNDINANK